MLIRKVRSLFLEEMKCMSQSNQPCTRNDTQKHFTKLEIAKLSFCNKYNPIKSTKVLISTRTEFLFD